MPEDLLPVPVPPELSQTEIAFAQWRAAHARHVPRMYTRQKLQELSGYEWSWAEVTALLHKRDFARYLQALRGRRQRGLAEVREQFEAKNIPAAVAFHREAIKLARAKKDYKAAPALLEPAVKVLYPRHADEHTPQQITINVGGEFARKHLERAFLPEAIDTEYTVLPSETPAADD